jgi:hypothetical protein
VLVLEFLESLAMRIPYVIDNQTHTLADVLNAILAEHAHRSLDFATAYFYLSGHTELRAGGRTRWIRPSSRAPFAANCDYSLRFTLCARRRAEKKVKTRMFKCQI